MIFHTVALTLCLLPAQVAAAQAMRPQTASPADSIRFEAVPGPADSPPPTASGPRIEAVEFRGAKRVPVFVLRAVIASRAGGAYDVETLRHDSQALYRTGRFSDVMWESEPGPAGAIVRFLVLERPLIEAIEYQGDEIVTIAEILRRFEEREIRVREETLLNDEELRRATTAIQELLSERGRRDIAVTAIVEPGGDASSVLWPPSSVRITFRAQGPRDR